jgi:hypothetical protein
MPAVIKTSGLFGPTDVDFRHQISFLNLSYLIQNMLDVSIIDDISWWILSRNVKIFSSKLLTCIMVIYCTSVFFSFSQQKKTCSNCIIIKWIQFFSNRWQQRMERRWCEEMWKCFVVYLLWYYLYCLLVNTSRHKIVIVYK